MNTMSPTQDVFLQYQRKLHAENQSKLEDLVRERDEVQAIAEQLEGERDEVQATAEQIEVERDEIEAERDQAMATVEELQAELEAINRARQAEESRLREALDKAADHERQAAQTEAEAAKQLAEKDSVCALAIDEATQAVSQAKDDRFRELLLVGGIGFASMIGGVYLQRKYDLRFPWILGVGVIAGIAGYRKKSWSLNTRRALLGTGGGLMLATGVVWFIDALPGYART